MKRTREQLTDDARSIWQAGVDAVQGDRLVEEFFQWEDGAFSLNGEPVDPQSFRRVLVVGGGKAGAAMALGLERAFAPVGREPRRHGWLNIPAGTSRPTEWIKLHDARPAGRNEPTAAGVDGTQRILDEVARLTPNDWCIVLLSGGGSALLPAPIEGLSLELKQQVTRFLSGAGANIEQLNTVRKALSRIKGGGLSRQCQAGRMDTLIISDVLGDPLDVIASGPTVPSQTGPADALSVLEQFDPQRREIPETVYRLLEQAPASASEHSTKSGPAVQRTHVIGNLAVAVDAAGIEAERRGYSHAMDCARQLEGSAESVGIQHARLAYRMLEQPGPDCLITGGEPTVELAPVEQRGQGGRNQQLVLAAWRELRQLARDPQHPTAGLCLLSGGTDGEDGPTDAAGGWIDAQVSDNFLRLGLDIDDALARNDAYPILKQAGGLLMTGPTHTNVCDLRVVVVERVETPGTVTR